jgi:hypothetical protein
VDDGVIRFSETISIIYVLIKVDNSSLMAPASGIVQTAESVESELIPQPEWKRTGVKTTTQTFVSCSDQSKSPIGFQGTSRISDYGIWSMTI